MFALYEHGELMSGSEFRIFGVAEMFGMCELTGMDRLHRIAALRSEMGKTLGEFAELIGLSSKGHLSQIERDNRCALNVALRIEELSGGRLNAADLSDDVRAARSGRFHGATDSDASGAMSPGNTSAESPSQGAVA